MNINIYNKLREKKENKVNFTNKTLYIKLRIVLIIEINLKGN